MFPAINTFAAQDTPDLQNITPREPGNENDKDALARQIMELFESTPGGGRDDKPGTPPLQFIRQDLEKMFEELNSRTCPKCGMSSAQSLKTMQLGCRDCLDTFREEYRKLLEKQQNEMKSHRRESTLAPAKSAAQEYLTAQIELLEDKLQNAVKAEEYEQAAELKSKIQSLYALLPKVDAASARSRKKAEATSAAADSPHSSSSHGLQLWLPEADYDCRHHIRLRSFVRYERNLAAVRSMPPYTDNAQAPDAAKALEILRPILQNDPLFHDAEELDLRNVPLSERRRLYLYGVAPWNFLNGSAAIPTRIFISRDRHAVALLNCSAHLSVTLWNVPDLKAESAREIQQLDKRLSTRIAFASDNEFGAITRSLTTMGSGVTIGEVLHLPLLLMESGFPRIANGCKHLGYRAGISFPGDTADAEPYANGGNRAMEFAAGGIMTVTDAFAMGHTLNERCRNVQRQAVRLANHEMELRRNLPAMPKLKLKVMDSVGRSAALIGGASLCSPVEYRHILSALWLGLELGMLTTFTHRQIFSALGEAASCDPKADGSSNSQCLKRTFLKNDPGDEA
jgi:protein-arginine kinase activator protein McsA/protein-arginine kinase